MNEAYIELDNNMGNHPKKFIFGITFEDAAMAIYEYKQKNHGKPPDELIIYYNPNISIRGVPIRFEPSIVQLLTTNDLFKKLTKFFKR